MDIIVPDTSIEACASARAFAPFRQKSRASVQIREGGLWGGGFLSDSKHARFS